MRFCSANLDSQRIFGIPSLFCRDLPWLCGNRQNTQFKAYMQTSCEVKLVLAGIQLIQNLIVHLKVGREVIRVMIKHQVLTTVHHSSRTIPWSTCIKPVTSRLEKSINLVFSYQYWLLSWPLQNYLSVFVECFLEPRESKPKFKSNARNAVIFRVSWWT